MSSSFYFASRGLGHGTSEYDATPFGSSVAEFYSRPVEKGTEADNKAESEKSNSNHNSYQSGSNHNSYHSGSNHDNDSYIQQKVAPRVPSLDPPVGSLLLNRKVPLKADPKAMFSVERLFMLWLHTSLWLLAAALTIITYSGDDPVKFMYGAFIVPVALSFTVYSVFQCKNNVGGMGQACHMIRFV